VKALGAVLQHRDRAVGGLKTTRARRQQAAWQAVCLDEHTLR
jgi:hypothetical protein